MWEELKIVFQMEDELSEMPMEKNHKLKFIKKEAPRNLSLRIAKITIKYKHKLPDLKKMAPVLRLGKLHYADMLALEERAYRLSDERTYTAKGLIERMSET